MSKKRFIPILAAAVVLLVALVWVTFSLIIAQEPSPQQAASGETAATERVEEQTSGSDQQDGATTGNGVPRIEFPENVHDFGNIPRGAKVTHNFKVRNTGDAPLRIIKAKGG